MKGAEKQCVQSFTECTKNREVYRVLTVFTRVFFGSTQLTLIFEPFKIWAKNEKKNGEKKPAWSECEIAFTWFM